MEILITLVLKQKSVRVITFVSFLVIGSTVVAQTTLDRLEIVLRSKAEPDSNRVMALNNLAYKYLAYVPAKAEKYSEAALGLARKLGFTRGEAIALINLGDYEFRQSNYAKAIEYQTQVIRMPLADSVLLADAYLGHSHTYGLKQYEKALQYQLKALAICKTRGEKGTGLGLLLCFEMAQRNNGNLSVKSEVGIGTSFTQSLPIG